MAQRYDITPNIHAIIEQPDYADIVFIQKLATQICFATGRGACTKEVIECAKGIISEFLKCDDRALIGNNGNGQFNRDASPADHLV